MMNDLLEAKQTITNNTLHPTSGEVKDNWKRSILPYAILGLLLVICEFLPNFYDKTDTKTWLLYLSLRIMIFICAVFALYQTNKYYKNKVATEIRSFVEKTNF